MELGFTVRKTCYVYNKPKGEVCNRLYAGMQIRIIQRKDEWMKITWRNSKKTGWLKTASIIKLPENPCGKK